MYKLLVSTLFAFIILAAETTTNAQSLQFLTPVSDPFDYQNEYYPITVGNYWQMLYLAKEGKDNYGLVGRYEYKILEYTFEEIYFGDSLEYVPVFKKESKFFRPNSDVAEIVNYSYLIKTYQGIVECRKPPSNNKIKPYVFIPSDSSYDFLSQSLTGMTIDRDIELKTRFWEMNTIRINYKDKDNLGGLFYSKDKGHVYTQFYYKNRSSNYPNKFIEGLEEIDYEPISEFILSEFRIE